MSTRAPLISKAVFIGEFVSQDLPYYVRSDQPDLSFDNNINTNIIYTPNHLNSLKIH